MRPQHPSQTGVGDAVGGDVVGDTVGPNDVGGGVGVTVGALVSGYSTHAPSVVGIVGVGAEGIFSAMAPDSHHTTVPALRTPPAFITESLFS